MPWYFIIYLGIFVFCLINGFIRRLPKYRNKVISLTEDRKEKFVNSSLKVIKAYKLIAFMSPIYLGLLPYFLYRYDPHEFAYGIIMIILLYVMVLESYMFRRGILKEIEQRKAKELHFRS